MKHEVWVIIPFYNEAKGIEPTLRALANQSDREFHLLLVDNASTDGRLFYRGTQFKYPFFMAAGGNMAITAKLYAKAGGFTRSSIADTNEDTELAEKVRVLTTRAKYRREMAVYASIRRVRKYGYIKTLRWFSGRGYRGEVDVR